MTGSRSVSLRTHACHSKISEIKNIRGAFCAQHLHELYFKITLSPTEKKKTGFDLRVLTGVRWSPRLGHAGFPSC